MLLHLNSCFDKFCSLNTKKLIKLHNFKISLPYAASSSQSKCQFQNPHKSLFCSWAMYKAAQSPNTRGRFSNSHILDDCLSSSSIIFQNNE